MPINPPVTADLQGIAKELAGKAIDWGVGKFKDWAGIPQTKKDGKGDGTGPRADAKSDAKSDAKGGDAKGGDARSGSEANAQNNTQNNNSAKGGDGGKASATNNNSVTVNVGKDSPSRPGPQGGGGNREFHINTKPGEFSMSCKNLSANDCKKMSDAAAETYNKMKGGDGTGGTPKGDNKSAPAPGPNTNGATRPPSNPPPNVKSPPSTASGQNGASKPPATPPPKEPAPAKPPARDTNKTPATPGR
jgi:hypothetical protein